ncbi:MAG TPA: hypothetical protein VHC44_13280 [Verrucomicrobiae bacterium]|nr:hypothetical protein [Verrucomicrobiae bacterium]
MLPVRPIDRDQVEIEARAKTLWGDPREEVVKYLMMQGITAAEATEITAGLFAERVKIVRGCGMKKIVISFPLMALPLVFWIVCAVEFHMVPLKIWAFTVIAGIYGLYCLLKGLIMFLSPGSEPGDVSDK